MKDLTTNVLICLVMFLLCSESRTQSVTRSTDAFPDVLQTLDDSVKAIQTNQPLDSELKRVCSRIVDRSNDLLDFYVKSNRPSIPADYTASLTPYVETIRRFAAESKHIEGRKAIDPELRAALMDLDDELRIKVRYAKAMRGSYFSDITVVVNTLRSGNGISGYEIWYVPKAWKDSEDHYRRFDSLSTPSAKGLSPGNYFFWAKKSTTRSEPTIFSIGHDGFSKRQIEIEVP
jgi:hypothetical protein